MALGNFAYDFEPEKKQSQSSNFKVIKNKNKPNKVNKAKAKKANKASLVITTLLIFTMLVIINYRYNIISEKNLSVQRLEMSAAQTNALLTNAEIEYSKVVDITEVEAYAKQQLGMQEPEKSQMVYLGSDYRKNVQDNSTDNFFLSIFTTIKQKISGIF